MENKKHTAAEMITILPIWTVRHVHGKEVRSAIRLFRSDENLCEHRGDRERCDPSGHYYGFEGGASQDFLKLCPRHLYAILSDPHPIHALLDMTSEEHATELGKLIRESSAAMARMAVDLCKFGNTLSWMGCTEDAEQLYRTADWLQLSSQRLA